jgi:ubiquinone/menaquinone biosynthesis C-methylase UbiE
MSNRHLNAPFRNLSERETLKPEAVTSKDYNNHVSDVFKSIKRTHSPKQGQTLLDIGSGRGHIAKALAEEYKATVHCCDVNVHFLKEAKQNCSGTDKMYFHLVEDDYEPLMFLSDESIDHAYAHSVFVHNGTSIITNYLKEIKRTLKVGGKFSFAYCTKNYNPKVAPNTIESDKNKIDSKIKSLDFNVLKNEVFISSTEGQPLDVGWKIKSSIVLLEK